MISLPNDCRCSDLHVFPPNWKEKKAPIKKNWRIEYRFYDPLYKDRWPNGYPKVIKKGINNLKTREERQAFIKKRLEEEENRLKSGYNPILEQKGEQTDEIGQAKPIDQEPGLSDQLQKATHSLDWEALEEIVEDVSPETPLIEALWKGRALAACGPGTKKDLKSVIKYTAIAAQSLKIDTLPVGQVSRKHIVFLLYRCGKQKKIWTDRTYTYYRSHLMILFKALEKAEAVKEDPVEKVPLKKPTQKVRQTLTEEERDLIDTFLRANNYRFWLFVQLFFHSGARLPEFMVLRGRDIDLVKKKYLAFVKKGTHREVYRPIKLIAIPYWEEVLKDCEPDQYIFSEGLKPGDKKIREEQATRRWKRWVKDKLGIKADLYSLKASNSDEMSEELDIEHAAQLNSHDVAVAEKHYAHGEKARKDERIRRVRNPFSKKTIIKINCSNEMMDSKKYKIKIEDPVGTPDWKRNRYELIIESFHGNGVYGNYNSKFFKEEEIDELHKWLSFLDWARSQKIEAIEESGKVLFGEDWWDGIVDYDKTLNEECLARPRFHAIYYWDDDSQRHFVSFEETEINT